MTDAQLKLLRVREGCLTDRAIRSARLRHDLARSINRELDRRPEMFMVPREKTGRELRLVHWLEKRQAEQAEEVVLA